MNFFNLLAALAVLSTSSAYAQFDFKLARKLVRVLKINLQNEYGEPLPATDVELNCNSFGAEGPRKETTNKDGVAEFGMIKQNSTCAILYQGKNIRQFSFSDYEPHTVSYLSLDVMVQTNMKREFVRTSSHLGAEYNLEVYLYKQGKRMKAIGKKVAISCVTAWGFVHEEEKKTTFPTSKAEFTKIPTGSECFIRTPKCSKNLEPMGFINFFEADHVGVKEIRMHINIPKCSSGGGGPGGGDDDEDEDEESSSSQKRPKGTKGKETPTTDEDGKPVTPGSGSSSEVKPVDPNSGSTSGNPKKGNSYILNVINKTNNKPIINQEVTIYLPETGDTVMATTDANGTAQLSADQIKENVEYLVFLGSEEEPVATLNMVSKVTYTKDARSQTAYFEVGSIRHNFDQNKYDLDPRSATIDELDQLALVMKQYPKLRVAIEGYTNSDADAAYNMRLSRKRAEALANYLIVKGGIAAERVEVKYFGESVLLNTEGRIMRNPQDGTEDKEASRRVEVKPNWDSMLLEAPIQE